VCPSRKAVHLSYQTSVSARGGSGQFFIAQPVEQHGATPLPSGRWAIGKAESEGTDIVIMQRAGDWLLSALVQELSAAGYEVRTVAVLPVGAVKGMKPAIATLSANQSSSALILSTVAEMKVVAEISKDGQLVKTVSVQAKDHEEGLDRSSEPIRLALEKTLRALMQELIPKC